MRGLLMVIPVLATLFILQPANTAETEQGATSVYSEKEITKTVESNLLSLFGFGRRPKVNRSKIVIPPAMLELYKEQTDLKLDTAAFHLPGKYTRSANTARSFTHVESNIDDSFTKHHRFRLAFDLKAIPRGEKLTGAELHLSRVPIPLDEMNADGKSHLQVIVHDIVKPGIRRRREPILRVIDSKVVDIRKRDVLELDVMPAVKRWIKNPKQNYGLLIEVTSLQTASSSSDNIHHHVRLRRSANENPSDWLNFQPILFTYTDDGRYAQRSAEEMARRSKRAPHPRKHKRKEGHKNCQRLPLYVDFASVGWNDWIVAPPGYDAYYCQGNCPFPLADHLNSTNHAIVQTLVNSMNPNLAPKACCVPTELSAISMLYLDDKEKLVLKIYQDMAVLGCGCR